MRPHPRLRQTIKWSAPAATILLTTAWLTSSRWYLSAFDRSSHGISLRAGVLWLGHSRASSASYPAPGLYCGSYHETRFNWWFAFESSSLELSLQVPLWSLAAPALLASAAAWRLDALARRRARVGFCPICAYDRRGLPPDTPCPECGNPPTT